MSEIIQKGQADTSRTAATQPQNEAEIIRERIRVTLEHTFPALASFLAHGEQTPGSGDPLFELAHDAGALADLMAIFPPDAPEQPLPETTAHVSWLIQRLLTTGRACRSRAPHPEPRGEGPAFAVAVPSGVRQEGAGHE